MDTASLNEMIETAVAIEAKEGHLANYLTDRAHERGVLLGDEQRNEALELFEGYIRSVPKLLAAAEANAAGTPVEAIMAKVLKAAVTYWVEPDDLVPDALGVLGLLDDAYFSLRMLQLVSERLRTESGHPLIAQDLSALDAVVRNILGDHLGEVLDELVVISLSSAPIDELLETLGAHSGSFIMPSAETSFAGMSVDALVEERLAFAARPGASLADELRLALSALGSTLSAEIAEHGKLIPNDPTVGGGVKAVTEILRGAFGGELDEGSELELSVCLLVGALVQRVLVGGSVDDDFVDGIVALVLDGLG